MQAFSELLTRVIKDSAAAAAHHAPGVVLPQVVLIGAVLIAGANLRKIAVARL